MSQLELDLLTGLALSRSGAQQAADHAGEVWKERAISACYAWCVSHREPFQLEQIRVAAESEGLPPPPDRRAWGWPARHMVDSGWARRVGYKAQRSVTCHGSPKPVYVSLVAL